MQIPKQLQNPEFRGVLLGKPFLWKNTKTKEITEFPGESYDKLKQQKEWQPLGKAPFEAAWQKKGYRFDDPKLLNHIKEGSNCGVIAGYGNLVILDIDDPILAEELSKKFNTFTVKTGSGGMHFYFIENAK